MSDDLRAALVLVIGRAPSVSHEGPKALRALAHDSPIAEQRALAVLQYGLSDPQANWTEGERIQIAEAMADLAEPKRDTDLRVRVTKAEKIEAERVARAAGLTVSAFIRRAFGLDRED